MGIVNPNKPKKAAEKSTPATKEPQAQQKPVSRKKSAPKESDSYEAVVDGKKRNVSSDDVERGKLLDRFHPENIKYLRDKLGLDVTDAEKCNNAFLDDLLYGRVTKPVEMTVTPLAYDYGTKSRSLEMPQITILSSVRMIFPHDNKFNQIAIDPTERDSRLYVATYPHYLKCEKAQEEDVLEQPVAGVSEKSAVKEKVEFTDAEKQALEGIGISSQRLYGGRFNSIDQETKQMMKDGEDFVFTGTVNTEVGALNVSGIGRLSTEEGKVSASFETLDQQEGKDLMLDIMSVRKVGNLELDFFERDSQGKILRDEEGQPRINRAGWNLIEFGQAMEPVAGYVHSVEWSNENHRYEDKVNKGTYQVSVVNGGLVATSMKQGEDKRYEVATRMKDGKVFVGGQYLEFASEKDRDMYIHGFGGVVKGATWKDYSAKKDVKYDAFIVADNKKGGYGVAYSPSVSEKLIARRAEQFKTEAVQAAAKAKKAALLKPKKQGFSIKH